MRSERALRPVLWQRGFTLIELLVAIALGIFLTWGVIEAFMSGKRAYSLQQSLSRIQESGRLAQEFIGSDIRMSGDYGCGSSDSFVTANASKPYRPNEVTACADNRINMVNVGTNILYDFDKAVFGYNNVTTNPISTLSPDPLANTDVLVLHPTRDVGTLQAELDLNASPGSLSFTPNTFTDTNAKFISVADCANLRIYQISNSSGTIAASGPGTISGCAQTGVKLAQGATIKRIDTVIYYVAEDATNSNIPTLYRYSQVDNLTEALLPGVEDMQIEFGIDGNSDNNIDDYNSPEAVIAGAWSVWDGVADNSVRTSVRAVRYALVIRAESVVLAQDQVLAFPPFTIGATITKTDKKMRQVFSEAVAIRSRVLSN